MEEKKDLNQVDDLLADLDDEGGIESIQSHRIEKKPLSKKLNYLFGYLVFWWLLAYCCKQYICFYLCL